MPAVSLTLGEIVAARLVLRTANGFRIVGPASGMKGGMCSIAFEEEEDAPEKVEALRKIIGLAIDDAMNVARQGYK